MIQSFGASTVATAALSIAMVMKSASLIPLIAVIATATHIRNGILT
jgi:hypothetical protein